MTSVKRDESGRRRRREESFFPKSTVSNSRASRVKHERGPLNDRCPKLRGMERECKVLITKAKGRSADTQAPQWLTVFTAYMDLWQSTTPAGPGGKKSINWANFSRDCVISPSGQCSTIHCQSSFESQRGRESRKRERERVLIMYDSLTLGGKK